VRGRKNSLPSIFLTLALWASLAFQIFFVQPQTSLYPSFFINFFLVLFLTITLIFKSRRRGLVWAACVTIFLLLRLFGLGGWINFILIAGIVFALESYFTKKA